MQTVSLEVARRLKEYLPEGKLFRFYWLDDKLCMRGGDGTFMSLLTGKRLMVLHYHTKIIPTPALCEMLEIMPNVITVPARKREGNEVVWVTYQSGGRNGRGRIGLLSLENHIYSWYKYSDIALDETPATAAALLYLWLIDNGYIKGGENGLYKM